jgi:iron complex outermembrane receptor protein
LLTLWVFLCLGGLSSPVSGQEEDGFEDEFALLEEEIKVDEVESASKHRQSIFWSPSSITVLTKEDIRSSGATNFTDLLRRVPGFDIYDLKSSYPLVGARALTESSNNLVLVLIDGREALVELLGISLWSALTVVPDEVERIEVIRGPGSTLYGANAFAAVVNITTVTDRPQTGADVSITGAENGIYRLFARARGATSLGEGTLTYSAGLASEERLSPSDMRDAVLALGVRSHGYIRYQKGREMDLSLHLGITEGRGIIYLHIGDMRLLSAVFHWEMGRARFSLGENTELKFEVYHSRYEGTFQHRSRFRALDIWIADLPRIPLETNTIDTKVQFDWNIADSLLLIGGGNLRYDVLETEKLVVSDKDELRGAGFAQLQWSPWDILQFTGGLRFDVNSETEAALSPRAVAVFRPWPDNAFRLGYGLAFRKPSAFESRLHALIEDYNPATPEVVAILAEQFGNENLVNEKVHSFEAGWRGRFLYGSLNASLDLFYNLYQDTIYFKIDVALNQFGLPDIGNSTFQFENEKADIRALGGEADLVWHLDDSWTVWGNLGLRRVTDEDGETIPSEPVLRANLGGRYLPATGISIDIALHYVSSYEMPLMDPENVLNNPSLFPLGDKILAIGRVGYRLPLDETRSVEAGLTVRTPLGSPFREYPGIPMPAVIQIDTASDFGGEVLQRMVSFYFRGSF